MTTSLTELLGCLAVTLAVGAVLGTGVLLLARRSLTAATAASPLVALLAAASGIGLGIVQMTIDEESSAQLLLILVATFPVALGLGALVAMALNRAEKRRAQAEADQRRREQVEAARRDMIAWLSHDLRTPLAGIRAMTEALLDGVASPAGDYPSRILTEVDRTSAMVDDLLVLSGLHAGVATRHDAVDLGDVVSDAVAAASPVARAAGVQLSGSTSGPCTLTGDTRHLARAVANVVANAVRHTPPGRTVTVTTAGGPDSVTIGVQDACGGITADEVTHAFEAGWRGSAARTPTVGSGAGLGLAIVAAVAHAHGGDVGIAPSDPGCLVWMRLPRT